jgi:hypothetical protein
MRWVAAASLLVAAACTNSPVYLPSPTQLEAGLDNGSGGRTEARASVQLPIVLETEEDRLEREELQMTLDPEVVVPYVRIGDLEVSVEWVIKNLTGTDGLATIQLNGANQFFSYDPSLIVLSSDDDTPPSPPLLGDVPLRIPANGELRGIFREDELREASFDLDQITRGNINPYRAVLVVDKHRDSFAQLAPLMFDEDGEPLPQQETGLVFPREAIAQLLRIDLVFRPDRHMVLEFTVRVRDVRGDLLHELALDAFTDPEAMAELEPFMPAEFSLAPPAPGMP